MSHIITKEQARRLLELKSNSMELRDMLEKSMDKLHTIYKSAMLDNNVGEAMKISINQCADTVALFIGSQVHETEEELSAAIEAVVNAFTQTILEKLNFFVGVVGALRAAKNEIEKSAPPIEKGKLN